MNWWKFIAIIAIIFFVLSIVLKGCGKILSNIQSVPEDYTVKVETAGSLEEKYISMGKYDVSYYESPAMMSFEKYEIFYPTDIAQINEPLPVIVYVNGTGVGGSKYKALQQHMASWGFITIATEEQFAWNGFSAEMCVRYLKILNNYQEIDADKENVFYGKIDLDNVGISGHSQGGIGVINAITDQKHSDIYKASVILSCGNTEFSSALQWDFDDTLVKVPSLILGSTGKTDSQIASLESLQKLYNNIPNDITKVLARRINADHGEMLYYGDGYVTAWFMYWLKDDLDARNVFFGENAELQHNKNWQDIQINQ